MRKMTVKDIQDVNIGILKHFDAFCKSRGLRYFLSEGTLLGAVRHHGFLPWDDDADVCMPRPDYNRFIKEYVDTSKYKLCTPERGNSFMVYARLSEMEETKFVINAPWTFEDVGVSLDILPLDGCSSDKEQFEDYARRLIEFRNKVVECRKEMKRPWAYRRDPFGFAKDIVHHFVHFCKILKYGSSARKLLRDERKLRQMRDYTTSEFCTTILQVVNYARKLWRRKWFDETINSDFCGCKFPIPAGYDERLKAEYGDYMTPPTEKDRADHAGWQKLFWRD